MTASTASRSKLTGVCPPARGAVIAGLVREQPAPVWLVVAEDLKRAESLAEDIAFFHGAAGGETAELTTLVFPESMPDSRDMREAFAASSDRLTVLSRLRATRRAAGGSSHRCTNATTAPGAAADAGPDAGLRLVGIWRRNRWWRRRRLGIS